MKIMHVFQSLSPMLMSMLMFYTNCVHGLIPILKTGPRASSQIAMSSSFPQGPTPIQESSSIVNGPFPIKPFTVAMKKTGEMVARTVSKYTPQGVKDFLLVLKGPIVNNLNKIKTYMDNSTLKDKFSKEELSKLGLYALLSYGFVSNFSYITCVIIAWCIHGKATGLSPLAIDQWKGFLAVYTGLYVANNFLRPARFGVSVLLAPKFEDLIIFIMKKTGLQRPYAVGLTVFLVNFCGTISYLVGGLIITTRLLGVPLGA